jgi:hypothetical protein
MFVTYRQAEMPMGMLFGNENELHWRYVELSLRCPWFYTTIGYVSGGDSFTKTLLIPSPPELERLLSEQHDRMWVEEVMLVSPGYMNGSDGWKMERLQELRVDVDDRDGYSNYVHVIEGGNCYIEGTCSDLSRLRTERAIFSAAEDIRTA